MSAPVPGTPVFYCASPTESGIPGQRSRVRHIDVMFDQSVIVDGTQISLVKVNGPAVSTGTVGAVGGYAGAISFTLHVSTDGNTLTLAPAGAMAVQHGSLSDGNYTLTIPAAAVMSQADAVPMASDLVATFFVFFGDTDGDMKVSSADLPVMQHAVGTMSGNVNYRSWLDLEAHGSIDSADYAEFNLNYKWELNIDGTRTLIPA